MRPVTGQDLVIVDTPEIEEVGRFLNRVDADLACGALQAAGIEATVSADDAAGTRPHLWMGGVRVLVPRADVDEARAILKAAEETP